RSRRAWRERATYSAASRRCFGFAAGSIVSSCKSSRNASTWPTSARSPRPRSSSKFARRFWIRRLPATLRYSSSRSSRTLWAKAKGFDVVIVDTAGRLHTQSHLMRELEKIHRVVSKALDGAPHEVLMVLDATNGQNAIAQAENFKKTVHCTGIILAKLDGTAKGGSIFAIKKKLGLPVKFIGVGEKMEDMEPFDPDAYVEALFE